MKFSFTSSHSTSDVLTSSHMFHQNLFKTKSNSFDNSSDDDDNDSEYTVEDTSCHKRKQLEINDLSLPLTDTIAEFVQELSEDKFFINDISFIFELSRKRAISPCAIVVALIYLKRLKAKSQASTNLFNINEPYSCNNTYMNNNNYDKYAANCLSNTELCLISLLLASKYLVDEGEDEEIYNDEWADLVDFPVDKVNKLERSILKQMDWELYVSESEFWSFTDKLTERITRKKVKYQQYQCTYTDLDCLLSNSTQFSVNALKSNLNYLTKIMLICSSTIVYMAISSFVISSCVFYLRTQLTANLINRLTLTTTQLTAAHNSSSGNDTNNRMADNTHIHSITNETNEMNLIDLNENIYYVEMPERLAAANKTSNFFEKICLMNENFNAFGASFFRKLWESNTNKQNMERLHLVSQQIKPISHHYYQLIL